MYNISTPHSDLINKRKNNSRKLTPTAWIRRLTSNMVQGSRGKDSGVYPNYTKEALANQYNRHRWVRTHTNRHYQEHVENKRTIYFQGNNFGKTLVMIDIDVKKALGLGSKIGADNYAQHLQSIWPNLYVEDSTNGNGVHGYLVLERGAANAIKVNEALKVLEKTLARLAVGFDIEMVEIKGMLPIIDKDRHGQLHHVQYGSFAKVPRGLVSRFEELQATTCLSLADIDQLAIRFADLPSPVKEAKQAPCGSITGKVITPAMLGLLPKIERYFEGVELKADRWAVTKEDLAIAYIILHHCTIDANKDGSIPTARVRALWNALYACGDVIRPFNNNRWTAIRNYISDRNMFNWISNEYHDGQAMRFGLSDEVLGWLVEEKRRGRASFDNTILPENTLVIRPKRKYPFGLLKESRLDVFIARSYSQLGDWAYRLAA